MKILKLVIVCIAISSATYGQSLQTAKNEIAKEDYFKAKKILNSLSKDASVSQVEINYYLGNIYLKTDEIDSAKMYYKKAFDLDNKSVFGNIAMGRINLIDKKQNEAKDYFDKAIAVSKSKNAEVFYQIGDAFFQINNYSEAITNLEKAYSIDSKNTTTLLLLGDGYLKSNDAGSAMNKYESAVDINPKLALAYLRIGRLNSDAHLYPQAIEAYKKAVELSDSLCIAWKELGENYYYNKEYSKVPAAFQKYVDCNDEDNEAKLVPCIIYYQLKEYQLAIDCCKNIIAKDPQNYIAYRIIGYANYELAIKIPADKKDSALIKYTEGYDAMKNFWNVMDKKVKPLDYDYSARLANMTKDTTKAIYFYNEALTYDSTNADIFSEYAKVLYSAKKYPEAIAAYANKIAKFTGGALDYFYLGRAYYSSADYTNADTTFATFIQMQPNSPDGYLWRAKSKVRLEADQLKGAAMPFYDKYIELAAVDAEKNKKNLMDAYLYGAVYYNSVDDNTKACDYFTKAKILDAQNDLVKQLDGQIPCK